MALTSHVTVIGTTGASGVNNVAAMITAHNAAIVTGVTTAQGVTGVNADNVSLGATTVSTNADGITMLMCTQVKYVVIS